MTTKLKGLVGLAADDLQQKAAAKFEEAAALPPRPPANVFLHAAEISGGPKMSIVEAAVEYRAYSVGDDGHIVRSNQFVAATDQVAVEEARQFVDGCDIELWSGDRLVARLKKQTRSASHLNPGPVAPSLPT